MNGTNKHEFKELVSKTREDIATVKILWGLLEYHKSVVHEKRSGKCRVCGQEEYLAIHGWYTIRKPE